MSSQKPSSPEDEYIAREAAMCPSLTVVCAVPVWATMTYSFLDAVRHVESH